MPLALLLITIVLVAALAFGQVAGRVVVHQRARTAADAAALAGLTGDAPEAARLAARNGARLVSFSRVPGAGGGFVVDVVVELDGITAVARASNGP